MRRSGSGRPGDPGWLGLRPDRVAVFRMEADWTGERRVPAASLTAHPEARRVTDVLVGATSPRELFSPRQRRFLREYADRPIDLDSLSVLGPLDGVRWNTPVPIPVAGFPVAAERWRLAPGPGDRGLDLLELSIRVEPDGAQIAQIAFEAALRRLGLDIEEDEETKTRRALALLTARP